MLYECPEQECCESSHKFLVGGSEAFTEAAASTTVTEDVSRRTGRRGAGTEAQGLGGADCVNCPLRSDDSRRQSRLRGTAGNAAEDGGRVHSVSVKQPRGGEGAAAR